MDIKTSNEQLTRLISRYGAAALEGRQVAKRLYSLLPMRFMELRRHHARYAGGSSAERRALVDQRFVAHVDEYIEIMGESLTARIQYETHAMLYRARQSLRSTAKARPQPSQAAPRPNF